MCGSMSALGVCEVLNERGGETWHSQNHSLDVAVRVALFLGNGEENVPVVHACLAHGLGRVVWQVEALAMQ